MGVVVTNGTVDFTQQRDLAQLGDLALHTSDHVGHFLAQGGWGGGLTVGAGQHRQSGMFMGQGADGVGNGLHVGTDQFTTRFQHQRMRQVVDVFGGTGEVHKFGDSIQLGVIGNLFLEEVLNCLDVMIGCCFDLFDSQGVLFAEVSNNVVEQGVGGGAESGYFSDGWVSCQALQPANFYLDPCADQTKFRENRPQCRCLAAVSAIDW